MRTLDILPVVIFDLDDTLYKEVDFVLSAYQHIDRLLVAGYDLEPKEAYYVLIKAKLENKNSFDELDSYLKEQNIVIPDAIDWMVNEYRYHVPLISLDKDAKRTLDRLHDSGIPMFIITDGRSITQRNKIKALGLDEYIPWENIFISEDVGCDKTNPYSFNRIRERCESLTDMVCKYIFIGDNPAKDFVVANKFGAMSFQLKDNGANIHPQNITVDKMHRAKRNILQLRDLIKELC